jgi:predicted dienelactone hydrolase
MAAPGSGPRRPPVGPAARRRTGAVLPASLLLLSLVAAGVTHAQAAHRRATAAGALPAIRGFGLPASGAADASPPPSRLWTAPVDPIHPGPFPVGALQRTFVRASSTTGEPRALATVIWYPAAEEARGVAPDPAVLAVPDAAVAPDGPFPVVLFSHGLGSTPTQSLFLTAHLASHGFVVAAPRHPGSAYEDCFGCHGPDEQQALLRDGARNRPDDLAFVLDELAALSADPRSPLRGALDLARVGTAGHSWGGYSAVMAAAAAARISAALAMAPVLDVALEAAAPAVHVPVLVMGGRLDEVVPYAEQARLYALLPTDVPRYLLTFPRGGHTAFADVCPPDVPGCRPGELGSLAGATLVKTYAVAFLRVFLLGDARYAWLLSAAAGEDVEFLANAP